MTCLRTYATLLIYSDSMPPAAISAELGIQSTREFARDPSSRYKPNREHNFWSWTTQELVASTDFSDHLRAIFDQLAGKSSALANLQLAGCETRISCYWDSDGQGGPWLDLRIIEELARLRLEIWWDIYFVDTASPDGAEMSDLAPESRTPG